MAFASAAQLQQREFERPGTDPLVCGLDDTREMDALTRRLVAEKPDAAWQLGLIA